MLLEDDEEKFEKIFKKLDGFEKHFEKIGKFVEKIDDLDKRITKIETENEKPNLIVENPPVPGMSTIPTKPRIVSKALDNVLDTLRDMGEANAQQIAEKMGKSRTLISGYLNRLYYAGAVKKIKGENLEVRYSVVISEESP